MKHKTIKPEPIIVAVDRNFNSSDSYSIYMSDLINDPIGTVYRASAGGNCGRDVFERFFEIVYKSCNGILIVQHQHGTTDDPNPEGWVDEDQLIWIENTSGADINTSFVNKIGSYESIKYGSDFDDVDNIDDSAYWDDEGYPCEP